MKVPGIGQAGQLGESSSEAGVDQVPANETASTSNVVPVQLIQGEQQGLPGEFRLHGIRRKTPNQSRRFRRLACTE